MELLDPALLLPLLAIVSAAYAVQTSTGFGAGVVTLTLGASLLSVQELIALLVPLSLTQTIWVAWRERASIDHTWLFSWVLPVMGGAMLVAFWALSGLGDERLKPAFGVMVLVLALWELRRLSAAATPLPLPGATQGKGRVWTVLGLLAAGVVHGVYACGGPMLVYVTGRRGLEKPAFRSTLTAVWAILGAVLLVQLALADRVNGTSLAGSALLLPSVPLGVWAGEHIFARVNERRFRALVNIALACAALALIWG